MVSMHPGLEDVIDYQLPEGTGTEDDGIGGGGADDDMEPSAKRTKAKAAGRQARDDARKSQGKGPRKSSDVSKATQDAMVGAMDKIIPTLASLAPAPSAARQRQEEAEGTSAKLALSEDLRKTYTTLTADLATQRAQPVVDEWYVNQLEKKLAAVKTRMEKDSEEAL